MVKIVLINKIYLKMKIKNKNLLTMVIIIVVIEFCTKQLKKYNFEEKTNVLL
jgi:hypothetical protein